MCWTSFPILAGISKTFFQNLLKLLPQSLVASTIVCCTLTVDSISLILKSAEILIKIEGRNNISQKKISTHLKKTINFVSCIAKPTYITQNGRKIIIVWNVWDLAKKGITFPK